jgi:hypothetical protein
LDTLSQVVNRNTSLVLRTDAAPFRMLVDGPANGVAPPRAAPSAAPPQTSNSTSAPRRSGKGGEEPAN